MDEPVTGRTTLPDDKPPEFANAMMRWALTTPLLERMVGQGVALLTFAGRRTGTVYTVPVSYQREGDEVTIVTKRLRRWWRNFETPHEVEIRIAGRDYFGKAEAVTDTSTVTDYLFGFLQSRPIDARAYGLKRDEITKEAIDRIGPDIVVIRIGIAASD